MTKMTLTIDGQVVEADEGMTLLEVARKNSIHIPTLCYHPVLEAYGACRLCTVEVKQKGGIGRACKPPARILRGTGWTSRPTRRMCARPAR